MPPITLNGDTGITTPMYNGSITANAVTPSVNMKNRLINGNMVIDQRNAGASVTPTDGQYTLDRWVASVAQTAKLTIQQNAGSVTPPVGFNNYLGVTSLSSYSLASTDYFRIAQIIEGFNFADLGFGTANAKTVTVSFWVRSSLTGTFGGQLLNNSGNRVYPFTYTISSANTWEQKSVTILGDTTGTWTGASNVASAILGFGLGYGSSLSGAANAWNAGTPSMATGATSVVGTNGATFYITGVQLEVGSTATSFDYRQYGTELALCQRYFTKYTGDTTGNTGYAVGFQTSTTVALFCLNFPVTMRSEPTCSLSNVFITDGINYDANVTLLGIDAGFTSGRVIVSTSAVGAQFRPCSVLGNTNTTNFITLSSEL